MKILDNGYLNLIEYWGSDQKIIEAARMSTDKGFLGWGTEDKPGGEKLLKYLWKNSHSTPFEQAGLTFEVQAPIMVFREFMRHRTFSYNEFSARYSIMPNTHYLPTLERIKEVSSTNKQAQGVNLLASDDLIEGWLYEGEALQQAIYLHYERGLELGIAKEVARFNTPVSRYSKMRASGNLLNWLKFDTLRNDSKAQWEIRQYAIAIGNFIKILFPRTWSVYKPQ